MNQPPFTPHLPNIARIPHPREVERLKMSIKKLQNMVRVTIFGVVALTTVGAPAGVMGWYKYFNLKELRTLELAQPKINADTSFGKVTISRETKQDKLLPSWDILRRQQMEYWFTLSSEEPVLPTFTPFRFDTAEKAQNGDGGRVDTVSEQPPQDKKIRTVKKKHKPKVSPLNTLIEELGGVEMPVQKLINYLYRTTRDRNLPVEAQGNYEKAKARAKELGLEMSDLAGHKDTSIGEYLKSKKKK